MTIANNFSSHYSRGGETDPGKHYATTYGVTYRRDPASGHEPPRAPRLPKASGFATNGRSVAPPSPVDTRAISESVVVHPPRPSRRPAAQFGIVPNSRLDRLEVPPGTTISQSSYVGYARTDGLNAPATSRARDSGFSRQVGPARWLGEGGDDDGGGGGGGAVSAGGGGRRQGERGSEVGGTGSRPQDAPALIERFPDPTKARRRRDASRDAGLAKFGRDLAGGRGSRGGLSSRAKARRARRRASVSGMNIGRKAETGFVAGNRFEPTPPAFEGSSTYRESYARKKFADPTAPLPDILRGDRATGFELGNKTERAGVPGVLSTNPRDLYPNHIHPKVLQRIKARDPVEFTNLLNVDRPMMSIYRAQFEKRIGEGDGLASAGRGAWDDVQAHASDLNLEATTAERISAAKRYIGEKGLSSFVKNNQPNIGIAADMIEHGTSEAIDDDTLHWRTVAQTSFREPLVEFPPKESDPAARVLAQSGFHQSVTQQPEAIDDPARRVSSKKRSKV